MRRGILLAVLAVVALQCWPQALVAQEREQGDRRRAAGDRRGAQLSPEETAKRTERMKKALEQRITYMADNAKNVQARRDELTALAAKATLPVEPPSQQVFSIQGAGGGRMPLTRIAYRRSRAPAPGGEARPARPGTLEVANTDEIKNAIAAALDAYAALLPLMEEQKKAAQTQLTAGTTAVPARTREDIVAAYELMKNVSRAQTAAGNAEVDLELLLAKAWIETATQKATSEEGKQAATAAQEALARYLALKPQLRELEQKIEKELATAQEGSRKVLMDLLQRRAPRRRDARRKPEGL